MKEYEDALRAIKVHQGKRNQMEGGTRVYKGK